MDYERLVNHHKDAVYRQMVRYCAGDREDAEDVLAEALMLAYRSKAALVEEEAFRSWLAVIGRRVCARLRHRSEIRALVHLSDPEIERLASDDPGPDEALQRAETKALVARGLERLMPQHRDLIELRDLQGLSGEETAQRLGLTLGVQKARLHRARRALREALDVELTT